MNALAMKNPAWTSHEKCLESYTEAGLSGTDNLKEGGGGKVVLN